MAPPWKLALAISLLAPGAAAQTLYEQARGASARGQADSAYDLIERAAEAQPNRAEVQWLLGQLACDKAGRSGALSAFGLARKCKAGFARAVELAPDSVLYLESLASFMSQAPGIVGGDKDSAMKLVERVRQRDDVRGGMLWAQLVWHGNADAKARADSVVEAVGEGHPGDRLAQLRVAEWWDRTNRPERSLSVYERIVGRDARDAVAHFFLGRQLVRMKREPRRAQEHLRLAAAATVPAPGPNVLTFAVGAPWYRLGQTYVQLGMPDSARICLERALQMNPQLTQAKAALDSLGGR